MRSTLSPKGARAGISMMERYVNVETPGPPACWRPFSLPLAETNGHLRNPANKLAGRKAAASCRTLKLPVVPAGQARIQVSPVVRYATSSMRAANGVHNLPRQAISQEFCAGGRVRSFWSAAACCRFPARQLAGGRSLSPPGGNEWAFANSREQARGEESGSKLPHSKTPQLCQFRGLRERGKYFIA